MVNVSHGLVIRRIHIQCPTRRPSAHFVSFAYLIRVMHRNRTRSVQRGCNIVPWIILLAVGNRRMNSRGAGKIAIILAVANSYRKQAWPDVVTLFRIPFLFYVGEIFIPVCMCIYVCTSRLPSLGPSGTLCGFRFSEGSRVILWDLRDQR